MGLPSLTLVNPTCLYIDRYKAFSSVAYGTTPTLVSKNPKEIRIGGYYPLFYPWLALALPNQGPVF